MSQRSEGPQSAQEWAPTRLVFQTESYGIRDPWTNIFLPCLRGRHCLPTHVCYRLRLNEPSKSVQSILSPNPMKWWLPVHLKAQTALEPVSAEPEGLKNTRSWLDFSHFHYFESRVSSPFSIHHDVSGLLQPRPMGFELRLYRKPKRVNSRRSMPRYVCVGFGIVNKTTSRSLRSVSTRARSKPC